MLVTGGAQGIGNAIAVLAHGLQVLLMDRDQAAGQETASALEALGEIRFQAADAGQESDAQQTIQVRWIISAGWIIW